MKIIKMHLLILITIIFGCSKVSIGQIPEYYFKLTDVFPTSYSFKIENGDKDMRFRALTVQPEEYSFIVIELMELDEETSGKTTLKKSFTLTDREFGLIVINEVQYLDWLSPKKLKVRLNGKKCYLINLENYKNKISIEACSE